MENATEGVRRGRPTSLSSLEIENTAMELFLSQGFDQTSMTEIAETCGIGRTTLFRYFPTKADLVWRAFDNHVERLSVLMESQSHTISIATAIRISALEAFEEVIDEAHLWRRRFTVQHETESLRGDLASRWMLWARSVSNYAAQRMGRDHDDAIPSAVGGAIQAAFTATLRAWFRQSDFSDDVVHRTQVTLEPICDAMDRLIENTERAERRTL